MSTTCFAWAARICFSCLASASDGIFGGYGGIDLLMAVFHSVGFGCCAIVFVFVRSVDVS